MNWVCGCDTYSFEKTEAGGAFFKNFLRRMFPQSDTLSFAYSRCCVTALCICNFGFKLLHNVCVYVIHS
jgi:hypothetical protein